MQLHSRSFSLWHLAVITATFETEHVDEAERFSKIQRKKVVYMGVFGRCIFYCAKIRCRKCAIDYHNSKRVKQFKYSMRFHLFSIYVGQIIHQGHLR